MQRLVDNTLAVTKESVKTVTYESLNGIARLINGLSALLLTFLPGKGSILEGLHGWELRPTFRGPRLSRWMENGVSSFNKLIHELPVDSNGSADDYSSAEDDDRIYPSSPSSQSSRASRASNFPKNDEQETGWVLFLFSWLLFPLTLVPICRLFYTRRLTSPSPRSRHLHSRFNSFRKVHA